MHMCRDDGAEGLPDDFTIVISINGNHPHGSRYIYIGCCCATGLLAHLHALAGLGIPPWAFSRYYEDTRFSRTSFLYVRLCPLIISPLQRTHRFLSMQVGRFQRLPESLLPAFLA